MTWGHGNYNCHKLPKIYSYAQAEKLYNGTEPVRGSNNLRPLGKRRTTHMEIVKDVERDADGGVVANYYGARLYNTDCVKFMEPQEDGVEVIKVRTDTYETPTTAAFIRYVLPLGGVELKLGSIRIQGHKIPKNGELTITTTKDEGWDKAVIEGGEREYVHKINRKAANAVRKRYKPLLDWVRGTLSLKEGMFSEEELNDIGQQKFLGGKFLGGLFRANFYATNAAYQQRREHFMNLIDAADDDPHKYDKYVVALHTVAHEFGSFDYIHRMKRLSVKGFEEALLRVHANEVLDRRELALGEVKRDPYKSWVAVLNT